MFLRPNTSCIFVYANTYETSKATIVKIYPNNAKDFWNKTTAFDLTLKVTDLKIKPELPYPKSLNIEGSYLFVQRDEDLIVFCNGNFYNEVLDEFSAYEARTLNCYYTPCPPKIARDIGEKAGLFKTQQQIENEEIATIEDPTIRRLKKIMRNLGETNEV
jgi:hypothetical protein